MANRQRKGTSANSARGPVTAAIAVWGIINATMAYVSKEEAENAAMEYFGTKSRNNDRADAFYASYSKCFFG